MKLMCFSTSFTSVLYLSNEDDSIQLEHAFDIQVSTEPDPSTANCDAEHAQCVSLGLQSNS